MSSSFDPNGAPQPADSRANQPPYDLPPASQPPHPSYPPYPPSTPPPPIGYPAQPQGYPYPYGSYPPPYNPYGYPPPPPPRQNNTALWVILGIVGIVVIGACVGCGLLAHAFGDTIGQAYQQYGQPIAVVETFCQDEVSANYSAAYDQFSPTLQATMTRDQFLAQSTARDVVEGTVTSCDVDFSSGGSFSSSSTSASIGVTMTRSNAGTFTGTLSLTNDQSAWAIDAIDPALPILTDGTPSQQATATPLG